MTALQLPASGELAIYEPRQPSPMSPTDGSPGISGLDEVPSGFDERIAVSPLFYRRLSERRRGTSNLSVTVASVDSDAHTSVDRETMAPARRMSAIARAESPGWTLTPRIASSRTTTAKPSRHASRTVFLTQ